jgi:hypothetical protein
MHRDKALIGANIASGLAPTQLSRSKGVFGQYLFWRSVAFAWAPLPGSQCWRWSIKSGSTAGFLMS